MICLLSNKNFDWTVLDHKSGVYASTLQRSGSGYVSYDTVNQYAPGSRAL